MVDESIQSVFRRENEIPENALAFARQFGPLVDETWIEVSELLTPDKMID